MKQEYRAAIRKGINASDLNGYKWTITPTGLEWSYGEQFDFKVYGEDFIIVKGRQSGEKMAAVMVGAEHFCDVRSMVEAYELATKLTIRNANRIY